MRPTDHTQFPKGARRGPLQKGLDASFTSGITTMKLSEGGRMFDRVPVEIRLWSRVEAPGPSACWLWTGGRTSEGYGEITLDNRKLLVHRLAYELLVGPIPEGMQLDHTCRVRHCVNVNHLEVCTGQVNTLRGDTIPAANAHKTHCDHGHPFDEANTHTAPKTGHRTCRRCRTERMRVYRSEKRKAA